MDGTQPVSQVTLQMLNSLIDTQTRLRDAAEALQLSKKAIELAPHSVDAWQTLGWAHYRAGAWKDSINALQKSIELQKDGGDPGQWFFLAMALWQLGEKVEARIFYDQAVMWMEKHVPQNEELRRFRAEAEEVLGIKKDKR